MTTSFLRSGPEVHRALAESAEWCERWSLCVSRADAREHGPVEKLMADHGAKLRYAVVGLELHRTASDLLRRLHENESLRLVSKADGTFSPNLYVFEWGNEIRVIVGGTPFADDAFTSEFQAATLSIADKSSSFALAVQSFVERSLRHAHLTTHSDLTHYTQMRESVQQDLARLSEFRLSRAPEAMDEDNADFSTSNSVTIEESPTGNINNVRSDRDQEASVTDLDDFDRSDIMIAFRATTREEGTLPQNDFLRCVARRLGFERLGKKIGQALKGHLRAAIRREIVQRDEATRDISPGIREIGDYDGNVLVKTVLAIVQPGTVSDRESVIRDAANYLGYRNITQAVRKELKNAISRGIRRGLLVADDDELRRA